MTGMSSVRSLALVGHVLLIGLILAGSVWVYVVGHDEPEPSLEDWAGFDAAMSSVEMIAGFGYAGLVTAMVLWWRRTGSRAPLVALDVLLVLVVALLYWPPSGVGGPGWLDGVALSAIGIALGGAYIVAAYPRRRSRPVATAPQR
jgi:hypothetical protein